MYVHQCARFCNNPRLVREHAIRRITNYLVITSKYMDLPDVKSSTGPRFLIAYNPCQLDASSTAKSTKSKNLIMTCSSPRRAVLSHSLVCSKIYF